MGSEGPSSLTVHVTGFKKFHGVSDNPAEIIVSNLRGYMQKNGLPKGLVLGSCNVLETAGEGALAHLHQLLESAVAVNDNGSSNPARVIWLHLGVNSGTTRFSIENQAVNEATFRCPDELGWKPQRVPIIPADGEITGSRETSLPVSDIARALSKKGYDVIPSDDAGRFFVASLLEVLASLNVLNCNASESSQHMESSACCIKTRHKSQLKELQTELICASSDVY